MTAKGLGALRPYDPSLDEPQDRSVPLSVVVLTKDEEVNIARCLRSVAWAEQVIVLDSGSTDRTVAIAESLGATVLHHPWLGYGAQRGHALQLPELLSRWVYFVDADEWVSPALAAEVAGSLSRPEVAGYAHRLRLVFMGRWIRHCGWYTNSWVVRLARRDVASMDNSPVGERLAVAGKVDRLHNDIVDEDRKGLASWLRKHIGYAELEAARRAETSPSAVRLRTAMRRKDTVPFSRAFAKEVLFPLLPGKPLVLFCYMYLLRGGFLDGTEGLTFCLYHAWHEFTVGRLLQERDTGPPEPSGNAPLPATHYDGTKSDAMKITWACDK